MATKADKSGSWIGSLKQWLGRRSDLVERLSKLVGLVPGLSGPADRAAQVLSFSDLRISTLDGHRRLRALDGHPAFERQLEESTKGEVEKVYAGGFKVEFELFHNGAGDDPITLRGMALQVLNFTPGAHADYAYKPKGGEVFAAGTAKRHEFDVLVEGNRVHPARWVIDPKSARYEVAKGAENMLDAEALDADGSQLFLFTPKSGDLNVLRGTVRGLNQGLYSLQFVFHYSVAGEDRPAHSSQRVLLYSDE